MTKQELMEQLDRYDDDVELVFINEIGQDVEILNIYSFENEVSSPGKLYINLHQ